MKIGISCYNINPNYKGGINSFTFGLIDGFASLNSEHNFQIYVNRKNSFLFDKYRNLKNYEIIILNEVTNLERIIRGLLFFLGPEIYKSVCHLIYKNITDIMDKNSDIIYIPTTFLFPYGFKKPTFVSPHDIQQFHYPDFFSKYELLNRKIHTELTIKYSDYIQASSEFMKRDFLEHFSELNENQIYVIREGVNVELFSKPKDTSYLKNKYNLPEEFLFFPAQLWKHKNHITVLKSLNEIKNKTGNEIPLVLTGQKFKSSQYIFDFIKDNNLREIYYLGPVPFDDLLALYQKAKFLITAVLYESSSLPILEAAASGIPIIASSTPPNIEMSSKLKINLFSPTDYLELSNLILNIWNNSTLINEQVFFNKETINYYSWKNVAQDYLLIIKKIVECYH